MTPGDEQAVESDTYETPSPHVLVLPPAVERELGSSDDSLGVLGRPFDHPSPTLYIDFLRTIY
jgi:hypothetical protein